MKKLPEIFKNNRQWVDEKLALDHDYFKKQAKEQHPAYLWIGCADSRVPANEITGLETGELFVHRNIANLVIHNDMSCLSVLQFAVEVLKVEHVIVCGHYGCGGVKAALGHQQFGLIDHWLRHIKDIYLKNAKQFVSIKEERKALDLLCELNVSQQVSNLCHNPIVQNAWQRNQPLSIHGWIYNLETGLLNDLNLCVSDPQEIAEIFRMNSE
ncbi:MAG: carbonate dehydratase [SAR324 cluster bacterium]|nr:carbonate dehydratase [SAR324 cluster bacterium]